MAGVFGDINSRADFFTLVARARADVLKLLVRFPSYGLLKSVQLQLEAIENWTAGGRVLTAEELGRINIGILTYRELETTRDDDLFQLREVSGMIDNYLRYWPDDAIAADPENDKVLWK